MMSSPAVKFYISESKDAQIYEYLASIERNEEMSKKLRGLANIERRHAEFWRSYLQRRGIKVRDVKIGVWKKFIIKFLRKILGLSFLVSLFEMGESSTIYTYYEFYEGGELNEEEKKMLSLIILDELEHEKIFYREKKVLHVENIRDMVLGMNDGLVEILGAVTGLSAVYTHRPLLVGLSGLIVGVAGALSMGIGTYVSVRSQRQVNEGIRRKLKIIFSVSRKRAEEEIKERLMEMGIPEDMAEESSKKIAGNKSAINSLIPEEESNERRAAIYTGIAYIIGVFFPVIPYFLAPTTYIALPFSIILAGATLAVVSTIISIMSGISAGKKVAEMLILGLGAAALSYIFGSLMNLFFGEAFI